MGELIIAANSLDMRVPTHKDVKAMYSKLMSDPRVMAFCPWERHTSVEATHEFLNSELKRMESGEYLALGMYLDDFTYGKNRGRFCGYLTIEKSLTSDVASIAFAVSLPKQRQGYGEDALSAATVYALQKLGAVSVTVPVPMTNAAARRVLEKAGYSQQYWFASTWKGVPKTRMLRYSYTLHQFNER